MVKIELGYTIEMDATGTSDEQLEALITSLNTILAMAFASPTRNRVTLQQATRESNFDYCEVLNMTISLVKEEKN